MPIGLSGIRQTQIRDHDSLPRGIDPEGYFSKSARMQRWRPRRAGGFVFPLPPLPGIVHLHAVKSDYDGAWKDLLHGHLREVLACYFPGVAAAVDWSAPVRFLDQELRQLRIAEAIPGNRVDILAEVLTFENGPQTIYLHLEVQSFAEEDFAARLHACFQGLSRATGGDVVTLAVLADLQPGWKPDTYRYSRLGCEVTFRFPVCKLLEILPSLDEDTSLPALAAKAQIAALQTSSNPDLRMAARWRLTRLLLEQGYSRADVRDALRLIAWMMQLPRTQTLQFREKIVEFDQMNATAYITDLEELAIEKGMEKGIEKGMKKGIKKGQTIAQQQAVIEALEIRFDRVPDGLREEIGLIVDSARLHALLRSAIRCADLESFAKEL
jgi:hypothetical protein